MTNKVYVYTILKLIYTESETLVKFRVKCLYCAKELEEETDSLLTSTSKQSKYISEMQSVGPVRQIVASVEHAETKRLSGSDGLHLPEALFGALPPNTNYMLALPCSPLAAAHCIRRHSLKTIRHTVTVCNQSVSCLGEMISLCLGRARQIQLIR